MPGPAVIQGRLAVRPGEDEAALSARVQRLEHIIYPRAVGWLAAGRLAWRERSGLARRRAAYGTRSSRRRHESNGDRLAGARVGAVPGGWRAAPRPLSRLSSPNTTCATGASPGGTSRTELARTRAGTGRIETASTASGFARMIASGTLPPALGIRSRGAGVPRPLRYRFDDGTKRHRPRREARVRLARRAGARRRRGRAGRRRPGTRAAGCGVDAGARHRAPAGGPRARHDRDDREGQDQALPLHAAAPREAQDRDRRVRHRRLSQRARRLEPRDDLLVRAGARLRDRAGRAATRGQARTSTRCIRRYQPGG